MSDGSAPREVSPEEYRQIVSTGKIQRPRQKYGKYLPAAGIIVVSLIVGFALGMQYQKGQGPSNTSSTAASQSRNGFGRFGGAHRSGGIGTVTAASNSSITIQNQRTGSNQTFKITSSTAISNNGTSANVSDIQNGDTVLIRTSSTDTGTATSIDINPSFGHTGITPQQQSPTDKSNPNNGSSTV